MRALFLPKYDRMGGSSRYMIYDYLDYFTESGIECTVAPLLDWRYLAGLGDLAGYTTVRSVLRRPIYYLSAVRERLKRLREAPQYDLTVVEKEFFPYVPYRIEEALWPGRAKLVTIYDDAMHIYYAHHPSFAVRLMCLNKIGRLTRMSNHVIVWNEYLGEYVRQYNPSVTVLNTGVDLRRYRVKTDYETGSGDCLTIGWIGTPSSFEYIRSLDAVLGNLAARYNLELRVVSSQEYRSSNIRVSNRRWSIETEVQELCGFDIGIMPLPDNPWTRGKSGCKAIQYMAVAVPAVCSPVGIAVDIIRDGENGYLAGTTEEWHQKLSLLIENPYLRRELGRAGRQLVKETFSVQAVAPRFIKTLKTVAGAP